MNWLQAVIIAAARAELENGAAQARMGWLHALIIAAAVLGGLGVFLLMPRGAAPGRNAGMGVAAAGLVLLWVIWSLNLHDTPLAESFVFYLLGTLTVVSAVMTVTHRNPVASALWFGGHQHRRAVHAAGRPVSGRGHGDRLRRGDRGHVPVRDHAGAAGRYGQARSAVA
jgi:hypothetical protein